MMILLQVSLLSLLALIGLISNWLLILAIQRKTFHYQQSQQFPNASTSAKPSILRPQASISGQLHHAPLLPSSRSSISIFDKFILAFLVNDVFVCNFLLPLHIIDLLVGLPCGFLCFILKFGEKLTTISEVIIINLVLISSLIFFLKKRLLTSKIWFVCFLSTVPIVLSYLSHSLAYLEIDEYGHNTPLSTCKQTFYFITTATQESLNIFSCSITYAIILINFLLLVKMKSAIKTYQLHTLETFTETAQLTRADASNYDSVSDRIRFSSASIAERAFQNNPENHRRRSLMFPPNLHHQSITLDTLPPNSTPPIQRAFRPLDYLTYLTMIENSQTLLYSTHLILLIYSLVHIPYWFYELTNYSFFYPWKDFFYLSHICKPCWYMLTNEKYRHHVWAVLQCQTFRILPNLLRRKSRVITLNNSASSSSMHPNN